VGEDPLIFFAVRWHSSVLKCWLSRESRDESSTKTTSNSFASAAAFSASSPGRDRIAPDWASSK
jgi:hypothetical protein